MNLSRLVHVGPSRPPWKRPLSSAGFRVQAIAGVAVGVWYGATTTSAAQAVGFGAVMSIPGLVGWVVGSTDGPLTIQEVRARLKERAFVGMYRSGAHVFWWWRLVPLVPAFSVGACLTGAVRVVA